jgi:hypothetical protein
LEQGPGKLHQKVSDARDVMEAIPTDTNVIAHNQAKAVYTRAKVESIRKSWQEKTGTQPGKGLQETLEPHKKPK